MRIIHINDGNKKSLNRNYMYELIQDTGSNGIKTISNLNYTIQNNLIDVICFNVEYSPWHGDFEEYDLRNGRNIQFPISKDYFLKNARNGNHLDAVFFINEKGEYQNTQDLLEQEKQDILKKNNLNKNITHLHPRKFIMSSIKKNEHNLHIRRNNEFMRGRQSMSRLGMFRK